MNNQLIQLKQIVGEQPKAEIKPEKLKLNQKSLVNKQGSLIEPRIHSEIKLRD